MREIKFRCWDTGINYMYYDPECYNIYNEEDNGLHSGYEDKYGTWHQNKLMQYTGLKDKNGVEIYEGDIVKAPHDFGPAGFSERVFTVHFDTKLGYQWHYWFMPKAEVIGNIYENSNLLGDNIEQN